MGDVPAALAKKKLKKLKSRLAKGGGTTDEALRVYGANALAAVELLPSLTALPEARVCGVRTEDEEERERRADERVRSECA